MVMLLRGACPGSGRGRAGTLRVRLPCAGLQEPCEQYPGGHQGYEMGDAGGLGVWRYEPELHGLP